MRWLYHIVRRGELRYDDADRYAPESLAREGFIHASHVGDVAGSAQVHFVGQGPLDVARIDPRRLDVSVELADSPRGPMPHVHGAIPRDAVRELLPLDGLPVGLDRVQNTRILLLAFEGMTLLDLVGAYEPISRLRTMGFDPGATTEIASLTALASLTSLTQPSTGGHRVFADTGVALTVERSRPSLDDVDVLVLPGGPGARDLVRDATAIAYLSTFPPNRMVATVCTGSLLLAATGRLNGRPATTHHSAFDELEGLGALPVRERVVASGNIITGAGVTSAIELGLAVVERLAGAPERARIAAQMEHRG